MPPRGNSLCQRGTVVDINYPLGFRTHSRSPEEMPWGAAMESNERYYRRRAIEERMAAQRAVTEQARAWHAKLAADFAERASAGGSLAVSA